MGLPRVVTDDNRDKAIEVLRSYGYDPEYLKKQDNDEVDRTLLMLQLRMWHGNADKIN